MNACLTPAINLRGKIGWNSAPFVRRKKGRKVLLTGISLRSKVRIPFPGPRQTLLSEVKMALNSAPNIVAKSVQERWAQLRSHKRIISKVKLLVEWDEGAAPHSAHAVTVDVSHSGCMAVVGADLPLHRKVRLIHPETGRKAEAEVVWRDHEAWDVGLELLQPDASFWGLKI